MRTLQRTPIAFLMAACAMLFACKSAPPKPPPPPPPVKVSLIASADVNPDAQNRPSPIVVRVYQLKDDAAFKEADFFTLFDKEQATLAAALVSREEFELAPGEHRAFEVKLSPDARCVGVAAAYRDIRNSHWRAQSGTPDEGLGGILKKSKMTIAVNRASVSIAPD
jgi:type VI secretion system protein VasD